MPVVAEMEFPVRAESKVFAQRVGNGKLRGQQRGARAGEKGAEDGNDFRFQAALNTGAAIAGRRRFHQRVRSNQTEESMSSKFMTPSDGAATP